MKRIVIVALAFVAGCGGTVGTPGDLDTETEQDSITGDEQLDQVDTVGEDTSGDSLEDVPVEDVEIECDSFHLPCEGECIDPMTDRSNCGECGNICPMEALCVWGECDCQPAGTVLCGDECVELGTDENCGECGDGCDVGIGEACREGTCACEDGWGICEGTCVNLQANDRFCGNCYTPCAHDWGCIDGICECLVDSCSRDGHVFCVDLMTNDNFCGICSNRCDFDERCDGGTCVPR